MSLTLAEAGGQQVGGGFQRVGDTDAPHLRTTIEVKVVGRSGTQNLSK